MTIKGISKDLKISRELISRVLHEQNIAVKSYRGKANNAKIKVNSIEEKEICKKYLEGSTMTSLAEEYGVKNISSIRTVLNRQKIIRRGKYSFKNDNLFKKKGKEIIQKYKKGESMISLGEKYNVNRKIIQRYLKKNKVKLRTQAEASGGISTDNYEEICRKYLKGDTTTSIAKHFNLGYDEICNILNRCGVEIRDKRIRHLKIPLRFHDEICRRYQNGETTYQLQNDYSKKLGISYTPIRSVLLHYKVELRGSSHPYDTITHAINGTGSFIKQRECELYVYGIKNYPEYLKVGISFNSEARANDDSWAYDLENKLLVIELNSREEAFFLEQAI